ncbi:MAG: hypothetical protein IKZ27_01820 [Kiritimatiellae bacterium]|nr:hypothetical protein [Kiritimatiellia bacterium]
MADFPDITREKVQWRLKHESVIFVEKMAKQMGTDRLGLAADVLIQAGAAQCGIALTAADKAEAARRTAILEEAREQQRAGRNVTRKSVRTIIKEGENKE